MLDAVNLHLEAKGIRIQTGTIVDATILHAPSSTNTNRRKAADSYSASSTPGSDRLNHCCTKYTRGMIDMPNRLPSLACLGIVRTHQSFQTRPRNHLLHLIQKKL